MYILHAQRDGNELGKGKQTKQPTTLTMGNKETRLTHSGETRIYRHNDINTNTAIKTLFIIVYITHTTHTQAHFH